MAGMGWRFWCKTVVLASKFLIDFLLVPFVAVFEQTYFVDALTRSGTLIKGRRSWICLIFIAAWLPLFLAFIIVGFGPDQLGMAESGLDSAPSVARLVLESFAINLGLCWYFAFQALIYFRRRRDLHDLSFFDDDVSAGAMKPASILLERDHE